jgi:hypothetical protein
MTHSEDDPMTITDAQLEAMTIEQRNAILADTTDIKPAPEDTWRGGRWERFRKLDIPAYVNADPPSRPLSVFLCPACADTVRPGEVTIEGGPVGLNMFACVHHREKWRLTDPES